MSDIAACLARPCTTTDEAVATLRMIRAVICDWSRGMCAGYVVVDVRSEDFGVRVCLNGGKPGSVFFAKGSTIVEATLAVLKRMQESEYL